MNTKTNPTITTTDLLRSIGLDKRAAVSVSEFAGLFSRKRGWGYRRIAAGDLHTLGTPGNLLIPVSEVLRYLTK